jgi:predicted nucleic acid-binding protein
MRPAMVVDASVAVKWLLPQSGQEAALELQDRYQNEQLDLLAPYLLVSEVGNVLWKRAERGDLEPAAARRCFEQLLQDCPILLDSPVVSLAALELARAHHRSYYDCLYLAWALHHPCDLVTADEKFFRALAPAFGCVRLLSDLWGS